MAHCIKGIIAAPTNHKVMKYLIIFWESAATIAPYDGGEQVEADDGVEEPEVIVGA